MLLIGVVASVLGIALALVIDWFPIAAPPSRPARSTRCGTSCSSPRSRSSCWSRRSSSTASISSACGPGEELKDGPPIHGNTRLEVIWTAIPAILIVGLCTYAYVVLNDIEEARGGQRDAQRPRRRRAVHVDLPVPSAEGRRRARSPPPQLYLPIEPPVDFTVQSKDVIHDFWVPAFRMKIDAVPGIDTHYRVTPTNRLGEFPVVCAELCGLGHAFMRQTRPRRRRARTSTPGSRSSRAVPKAGGGGGEAGGGRRRRRRGGRQDALHRRRRADGLRRLPHARRRRRHRRDRAEPRRGAPRHGRRGVHPAVDRRPGRRDRRGLPAGHHAADYGDILSPEQLDALVKYLEEVAGK